MTVEPMKPCPFCGEQPGIRQSDCWIGCVNPDCVMAPYVNTQDIHCEFGDRAALTAAWNTRTPPADIMGPVETPRTNQAIDFALDGDWSLATGFDSLAKFTRTLERELTALQQQLAKQQRIAELKERGTLANNLCPDHRDKVMPGRRCLMCELEVAAKQLAAKSAEAARMVAFANEILEDWPDYLGIDGCDLQDLAVRHGLLIGEQRTEYCKPQAELEAHDWSGCNCYDNDAKADKEWTCYHRAPFLKAALTTAEGGKS